MKFKLITPKNLILEKNVESVTIPGIIGELTALKGHDFLIAGVKRGNLYIKWTDDTGTAQRQDFNVSDGVAEVRKESVSIYVDTAFAPV